MTMPDPIIPAAPPRPAQSIDTGLKALASDTSFMPSGYQPRQLLDVLFRDLLGLCNGDQAAASRLLLDTLGAGNGYAVFRIGETAIVEVNRALDRHEPRQRLVLARRGAA
jgi:hypothetical protein